MTEPDARAHVAPDALADTAPDAGAGTAPGGRPATRWDDQWEDHPAGAAPAADEPVSITAYPNGPLLVRGPVELRTPTGEVIPPRRKTVALCRCGVSTLKPFCDGSHKAIGFTTEQEPPAPQPPLD